MKIINTVSILVYAYGIAMCFEFNPLHLNIFPGLVALAGAVGIVVTLPRTISGRN
jgi:hypothetical protein